MLPNDVVPAFRPIALLPTYDNAGTLGGVIDGVLSTGVPVIVVDDGSAEATADVLATYASRITVIRHDTNQGKAAALKTGFRHAHDLGYTHALTIDTDGQHSPADVPRLLALAAAKPRALVLGVRDTTLPGYPAANRLGRKLSNYLIETESGLRVGDSQCGLRVYPIAAVLKLNLRGRHYGYETEVLTRAHWAGVPIVQTPVRCVYEIAGGRVTHFRPVLDTARVVGLHVRLLLITLLRWLNPRPALRLARNDPAGRRQLATAISIGVLIGNLPVFGLHTLLSVMAAKKLKLQPLAVVAGSHVSTPPVGPVLIAIAIGVGHFVLHGTVATLGEFDPTKIGYLECLRRVAVEWTVGSLLFGTALAFATYGLTRFTLRYGVARHAV